MSGRESRSRPSAASMIDDDQITDQLVRLQRLLVDPRTRSSNEVFGAKVLQEACEKIRKLQRDVDDLSERLSELLASSDNDAQSELIRYLVRQ